MLQGNYFIGQEVPLEQGKPIQTGDMVAWGIDQGIDSEYKRTAKRSGCNTRSRPDHTERLERPMAKKPLPSPEELRQLLHYDPETGRLFWKQRDPAWFEDGRQGREKNAAIWNGKYAGKEALTALSGPGYLHGSIRGTHITAHRAAMMIMLGREPQNVDHINGDKRDNRAANLREASQAENAWNTRSSTGSTSPFKGVSWDKRRGCWVAFGMADGRQSYLGSFTEEEDAARAYDAFARAHFSGFGRFNFPAEGERHSLGDAT